MVVCDSVHHGSYGLRRYMLISDLVLLDVHFDTKAGHVAVCATLLHSTNQLRYLVSSTDAMV